MKKVNYASYWNNREIIRFISSNKLSISSLKYLVRIKILNYSFVMDSENKYF